MTAKLILGKEVSAEIYGELRQRIEALKAKGVTPGLAVVLVGEDPASQVYVRKKGEMCEELGMKSLTVLMPEETTQEQLLAKVAELNADPSIHGFLVQLPLPAHIDEEAVMSREDFDEELMRKLIQYVDLPSYAKDIDSVDFTDEEAVEDFFLSLFQAKDLSLYRTMTEQEKKDYLLDKTKGLDVSITAILKPKKEAFLPSLRSGVYYTPAFAEYVLENNSPSFVDENRNGKIDPEEDHRCAIAKSYEDNIYLTFDGTGHLVTRSILDSATEGSDVEQYLTNRRFFGVDNTISSITIYPKDFQAKKKIVDYIDAYNERLMEQGKDSIKTTDLPEMIFSNLEMVLDIIFLILILFTSISLVVAVFLIASILYANVLEKTREIGLFRALGFGKRHVFFIFALMSVLLGLISGVLGVILGYLSTLAVNALAVSFFPYYGVEHIAVLPPLAAFLLVLLSIFLALLSSLVPSLVASRKDPVRSLRGN